MKTHDCSFSEAIREALTEEMDRDGRVLLLGEDIGVYGGAFGVTRGMLDRFGPERIITTPISEEGFTGVAVGAALMGLRPVVEIMFMDFMTLVMDPVVNQAAKIRYVFGPQARCPLVLRTPSGGGRCYGPTHSQSFEAWFVHTPGLKVVAPSSPAEAKGLLKTAIRDDNPVLFLEHKMLYAQRGPVPDRQPPIPFGKARLARRGRDVTIVAWSWMLVQAAAAAAELAALGIEAEIIDLRTLKPMDIETVAASVRRTGLALVVDETPRTCGVAAEVACRIMESAGASLRAPVRRVTTPDVPISATPALERAAIPNADRVVEAAVELVQTRVR